VNTKILIISIALTAMFSSALAQRYATTDDGQRIILSDDGTWDTVRVVDEIPEGGPVNLTKPFSSKKSVKGGQIGYSIWYNPAKWSVMEKSLSEFAEYTMRHEDRDVMAMIIPERIEISLEQLVETAMKNVESASSEFRILDMKVATINGVEGKLIKLTARVQGIDFTYLNFYCSCDKGSFQFMSFTSNNLFSRYEKDLTDLISGFQLDF